MATARKGTKAKKSSSRAKTTASRRKPAARKPAARKTTTKRAASSTARKAVRRPAAKAKSTRAASAKKASATVAVKRPKLGSKPYTQSELLQAICADTGLSRPQVRAVMESLEQIASQHLNGAPKEFKLSGICKMVVKKKPATKARKGINPFTGEPTVFKAKPASKVVKIRALKKLKDAVA